MKNTGTEYMSTERTPTVRPDFSELLPPLTDEQLSILEADILKNGCYAPVIVNEDLVIVDGHNRAGICDKHGVPYRMAVFSFEDDLEAKQWALDTQKSRRNLSVNELCKIALKLRPEVEARAKANLSAAGGDNRRQAEAPLTPVSKVTESVNTRKELAQVVGVGEVTMGRAMKIEDEAPQNVKDAVDSGELTISQGYNITKKVRELPEDEQEQAAARAIEYEKAKKDLRRSDAEIDRRGAIARQFCTAYEKAVLLEATEENVRCWVELVRMTPDEMESMAGESEMLSDMFREVARILRETIIPQDWRKANEETEDEAGIEAQDTD